MALSLASILAESAARHPSRTAVVCGSERISYSALWEEARRGAAYLQELGVRPGDRVAVLLPNVPDFPRTYYGILAAGAVVVPVHSLLTPDEIAYLLRDSGACMLICHEALRAGGEAGALAAGVPCRISGPVPQQPVGAIARREAEDDAVVLYTSGTTGFPKGAVLSQSNLVFNASVTALELFAISSADVLLAALPLFHSFGQTCVMNAAFRAGASIVLMPRFDGPAALELMVREGVTVFMGVPTMYIALLDAANNDGRRPRLRAAASGGSSLPVAVLEAWEAVFGAQILEGYGLSETSPVASFNQHEFGRKPGTVGCGIWGVELDIARPEVDDRIELLARGELGEIVIRGHCVFKGYLNKPEATAAAKIDGWFRSGDLGTKDADGFITIIDRKKDMILRGGFNVYPREIEEVLMRHPAVKNVAVIGLPHATHGEEIHAVVVAQNDSIVDPAAIIVWSQEHLAKYKYPRFVHVVESLPLGPSGKVLKRELRATFASGRS
ncbi:MAG TPA: long-chain fatty acid--CoA ligase [Candidatus Baltobacteraceae bacterium]|jgi:long-chain acyl-CoA synthetase|nr:long-chain fatty acid--CoA ligase [Candidatus Baltobacteraceae bacterium]